MLKVENPLDIYLRCKDVFSKSLFDGIGVEDAAAEYHFALLNIQRHGIIRKWDQSDFLCQVMSNQVIKQIDDPMSQAEFRVGQTFGIVDHQFEGAYQPPDESHLIGRTWPQNTSQGTDPYDGVEMFGEEFHPLMENDNYLKNIVSFYMPPAPGKPSQSEIDSRKERATEKIWEENNSPLLDHSHYGPLGDGMTLHEIMMKDFGRWKTENSHMVSQVASMDPEAAEHELRMAHLYDAYDGWTSDGHVETQGTWDYEGKGTPDMKHPHRLGFKDYLRGLEFISPQARHDVHEHGRQHGFDSTHSVPHVSGGRVKRSMSQRFGPIAHQWVREPDQFGPNFLVEEEPPVQKSTQQIFGDTRPSTIHAIIDDIYDNQGESLHDRMVAHHNRITGASDDILPAYRSKERAFIPKSREYSDSVWPAEAKLLMGINPKTNEFYPSGKHPVYGEAWNPENVTWTPSDYQELQNRTIDMDNTNRNKKIRNHSMPHLVQNIASEHVPWKDEDWHNEDDTTTLSTHWGRFLGDRGGMGRGIESLMDILHDSHVHDKQGATTTSSMFSKDALIRRLEPNEKNLGLIGPFWHGPNPQFHLSPHGTSQRHTKEKSNWMWDTSSHNPSRHNDLKGAKIGQQGHTNLFRSEYSRASNPYLKAEWARDARVDDAHKAANALVSMIGMMNPPNAPMPGMVLSPADIKSDEQSSTGSARGWHHDQYGKGDREHRNIMLEEMGDRAEEATEHYSRLSVEAEAKERAGIALSEDEKDALSDAYASMISIQNEMIRPMGGRRQQIGFDKDHLSYKHEKLGHDMNAIAELTRKLKSQLEASGVELFPEDDKSVWLGNALNLIQYGNQYGNRVPHSIHGISSLGIGEERRVESMPQTHHAAIHQILHGSKQMVNSDMSNKELMEILGMEGDSHHRETIRDLKRRLSQMDSQAGKAVSVPAMRVADLIRHLPGVDIEEGDIADQLSEARKSMGAKQGRNPAHKATQQMAMILGDRPEIQDEVGLQWIDSGQRHPEFKGRKESLPMQTGKKRQQRVGSGARETMALTDSEKQDRRMYNAIRRAESIVLGHHEKKPNEKGVIETVKARTGKMQVPIGDISSPNGNAIYPIFSSPFFRKHWGHTLSSDFSLDIGHDGKAHVTRHKGGKDRSLVTAPEGLLEEVFPELTPHLSSLGIHVKDIPRAMRPNRFAEVAMHGKELHKSLETLVSMTDPDILIKAEQPFMKPMHRIFNISDLSHLRGFTGDWIVSPWHKGQRIFVTRKGDDVSGRDESGDVELPDDVKESFKAMTKQNFEVDVVKTDDDQYRIHDILMYDDEDVSNESTKDRVKMLRGVMEGVDPVHNPSASDTKITDDEGLEVAIEEVQKEYPDIVLRDAASTYMKGEKRHPKWVLISEDRKVDLMVLEREGDGPYDYRLGIGPITNSEKLGDRAVEMEDGVYMDVGTIFHDEKEYSPGDLVNVEVDSVSSHEREGQPVFTVHGGSISGDGEGSVVSSETLGLLTKGQIDRLVPHRVEVDDGTLLLRFGMGDVHYDLSTMRPMVKGYPARLAESQRPFWTPLASIMLKADIGSIREEIDPVDEGEEEAEPIIPPKKVEGTDHWKKAQVLVKACELMEKMLKQVGMTGHSFVAGPKGLGIDYATPTESPGGPTSLRDESSLPDFDPRSRPLEDPEEEYEEGESSEDGVQHIPLHTESGDGELTIDENTAVLRI